MDITTHGPAPGTAMAGDLLVDLQTRTLWLGVDTAVDPSGSVLISDMIALMEADDQVLLDAKAYTDGQILTRAPISHTHPSSQITDFTAAVQAVVNAMPGLGLTSKMIMMYSGSIADVGVGPLAGWHLCDGGNGTPDLRDKFVIGAGNKSVGDKNTPAGVTTDVKGGHKHTIAGTSLTVANLPSHTHPAGGLVAAGNTGLESATHTHSQYTATGYTVEGGLGAVGLSSGTGAFGTQTGGQSANHYHSFSVAVTGNTGAQGSGTAHIHDEDIQGDHSHQITVNNLRENGIAYYSLAFIMKL